MGTYFISTELEDRMIQLGFKTREQRKLFVTRAVAAFCEAIEKQKKEKK